MLNSYLITQIIIFTFFIAGATLAFGFSFIHQNKNFTQKALPYFVSIGTGMLLTISFTEFLPRAFANFQKSSSVLFLLGFFIVILAEKYIGPMISRTDHACQQEHHHNHGELTHSHILSRSMISHQAACSSVGCILVCAFFDGLEIPAAFLISQKTGIVVGLGMLFHVVAEGALAVSVAMAGGLSKKATSLGILFVSIAIIVGSFSGLMLSKVLDFEATLLPLASGVLLYVSIGHLLPAALNVKYGVLGILSGSALIYAIALLH